MADEKTPLLGSQESAGNSKYLLQKKAEIPFPACRHVTVAMTLLGYICAYMLRFDLSVALVSMVNSTAQSEDPNVIVDTECLLQQPENTSITTQSTGELFFTKSQEGVLLGAFFYGYITTQLIGGRLAERFGGKHVFGTTIMFTGLLTLLTPVVARTSFGLLVALRVLEGMASGPLGPSAHAILAQWSPPYENTKLGIIIYTGTQMGPVVTMSTTGVLSDQLGWPSVFYTFGTIACLWWVCWMFLMYNSPGKHPRISAAEREYIETAIHSERLATEMATPWRGIFTSMPFWAIVISHATHHWGFYMLLTCLPQFMNDILHFDVASNGFFSALPYVAGSVTGLVCAFIADYLRSRRIARTVVVRKAFNTIGDLGAAVCLIIAGYVGCERAAAVAMITLAVGLSAFANSGFHMSHLDIAPRFAGTLMGLSNTVASLPGIIAPLAVTALTSTRNTRQQWLIIFYISAAIYVAGCAFYVIFASGEEQSWAMPPNEAKAPPTRNEEEALAPGDQKKDEGLDNVKFVNT